jgi:hypothetical protein
MKGGSPWNLSSRFVQLSVRRGANLVVTPNFRETIERQLGRYEAPIPESPVNPDDSQATLPLPAQADCASDAVTQTRLMRRGRRAVLQQLFDRHQGSF